MSLSTPPNSVNFLSTIETSLPSKYEILNTIAEGYYATVSKAIIKNKRKAGFFALKRNRDQDHEGVITMIDINEVRILRSLRNENHVIRFIELLRNPVEFTLVLEYCRVDFTKLLYQDKYGIHMSEGVKKNLLLQLLSGISAIHSYWIIHRDLKPANILLSVDGVVKIADFGSSTEMGVLPELKTDVRTVWYMSPELCLGYGDCDQSVDIWSLGCIGVEFFSCKPALFRGTDKLTQMEKISKVCGFLSESVWPEAKGFPNYDSFHKTLGKYTEDKLHEYLYKEVTQGHISATNFLCRLLKLNATQRISALEAMDDVYFKSAPSPSPDLSDLIKDLDMRHYH